MSDGPPGDSRITGYTQRPIVTRLVTRYWAAVVVVGISTLVAIVQPWVYQAPDYPVIRSDGLGYHAWTRAWLDRDLSFCDLYDDLNWPVEIPKGESGRCAVSYPPGLALIRFPVMAGFTAANGGELRSGPEDVVVQLFGVLGVLVAVVATVAAARRLGSSWPAANFAALVVVFGTGMFHYATFDAGFAHGWISALVAVLALLTARIPGLVPESGDAEQDRLGPVAIVSWFVVPWLLVLLRQTSLVIIVGILGVVAVMVWRRDGLRTAVWTLRRPYLLVAAGAAVAVVGQVAYNSWVFGGLTLSSYGEASFQFERFRQLAVLFSIRKGVVVTYPIVLVAVAAVAWARRWWLLAAVLTPTLLLALVYGSWPWWDLGGGFGHRGFVDVAPLWAVALAVGLSALARGPRAVFALGAVACLVVTVGLMWAYWQGDIDFYGVTAGEWFRYGIGPRSILLRPW